MPKPRKIFFNGGVHFVTTSVEEGFMFPPNPLVTELLKKSIAQAQNLYPVKISALICSSTHVHMIIRVIDPQNAAQFMKHFKAESSHAINRLLGRKKRTIWCAGYDSPLIEDVDTVKSKIAYIYENATKDDLEDSIERFPGFNTFAHTRKCAGTGKSCMLHETRFIARDDIKELPKNRILKECDYRRERRRLIHKKKKNYFEIDCNAWMRRFGITEPEETRRINQAIVDDLRERERAHRERREKDKKSVLGWRKMVEQPVGSSYTPERSGKRMYTHSNDPKIRKATIKWIQALIEKGREVYERWKVGDTSLRYPLGLFSPVQPRIAEPIGW